MIPLWSTLICCLFVLLVEENTVRRRINYDHNRLVDSAIDFCWHSYNISHIN